MDHPSLTSKDQVIVGRGFMDKNLFLEKIKGLPSFYKRNSLSGKMDITSSFLGRRRRELKL